MSKYANSNANKTAMKRYDWTSCSYKEKEKFLDWLLNKRRKYNQKYLFHEFIVKLDDKSSDYDIFLYDWDHTDVANPGLLPKKWKENFLNIKKIIDAFKFKHEYHKNPRLIFGIEKIWTLSPKEIRTMLNGTKAQKEFPHLLSMTEEERTVALQEKTQTDYVINYKKNIYTMLEKELYEIIAKFENRKKARSLEEERNKKQKEAELKANIQNILNDEDIDPDW